MKQRKRLTTPAKPSATNDVELGMFEARLQIDKMDLDTEVSTQPRLAEQVSDRFAMAKSLRDQAKDDLKTVEAQRCIDIREEKETAGEKVTEKLLADLVQIDETRQAAFRNFVATEREVAKWEGLRDSWKNRGYMLTELCNLYHSSYFSDPSRQRPATGGAADYDTARADMAEKREARNRRG